MNRERTRELVRGYLDHELGAEEMAELQSLLRSDDEARSLFWDDAQWHALYRQWGEQEWGRQAVESAPEVVEPIPKRPALNVVPMPKSLPAARRKMVSAGRWAVAIGAAAAAVAAVVVFLAVQKRRPVATLERQAAAEWTARDLRTGDKLRPGSTHHLASGVAVLSFDQGARVVLEGPADFQLTGRNSMELLSGRMRASVPPPAHGFTVATPSFDAVDLGTDFGCFVKPDGTGELHVLEGEVALNSGSGRLTEQRLHANEAMRVDRERTEKISVAAFSFPCEEEEERKALRGRGDDLGAWRIASRMMAGHPSTVFHLDVETNDSRLLRNLAENPPAGSDARVHGCRPAEGRWPGKGALDFVPGDDHLEFHLAGNSGSLTLTAWLKVGRLHPAKNPIVMGQSDKLGEVTWYLYGSGLGVGVLTQEDPITPKWHNFHSGPMLPTDGKSGWIFAAVVLDGETGTATHYFNGKPVANETDMIRSPLQLQHAIIGNLSLEPRRRGATPDRFEGAIDSLTVFSTALPPEEIHRLFEMGVPDSPR
ncbi:MAG: FecR domain-containing protein [Akkermansiaceae bacterium]|nr:FecR domain-containing protein [Akkermansiaceae bacterium]